MNTNLFSSVTRYLLCLLVMAAGCGKKQAPVATNAPKATGEAVPAANQQRKDESVSPSPKQQPPNPPPQQQSAEEPTSDDQPAEQPTEKQTEQAAESEPDDGRLAEPQEPATQSSADEPPLDRSVDATPAEPEEEFAETHVWAPAHRLFLPTTAGPLLVDVEIRLGDKLLTDVFDERIEQVIQDAKKEGDQHASWEDLFAHVNSDPEQFGNQRGMYRGQYREMIRVYDRNRNKRPDVDEAPRFLFRNRGIDVPFRLMGTDYYRELNRSESVLFTAIDSDGNGSLDQTELAAAPRALFRFDPNADQRIDAVEVIPAVENDPAWQRRRSSRRGEVAMDLEGYVDWTMVSYSLESMSRNTALAGGNNPIARIDGDQNKMISTAEAKELREGNPDLRLRIELAPEASDQPTIDVVWLRPELRDLQVSQPNPSELAVSDDGFSLLAIVTDRRASRNRIPRQVFEMLDANNDGALEPAEIPDAVPDDYSFEDLDADDNGKLTYEEINTAPQRAMPPIWSIQVRARGAEYPDGVFAFLDTNHDRFLSSREILSAEQRLRKHVKDNGVLKPTDIPDTFAIQFLYADPMQDEQNFGFRTGAGVSTSKWPNWAKSMDTNRDGEISQVEFPGTLQQFERLDTSGDGFLNDAEVKAAK